MQRVAQIKMGLPSPLYERLLEEAQSSGQTVEKLIVDILQKEVEGKPTEITSEKTRAIQLLEESGLLANLGPEWDKYIEDAPDMTVEEIREALRGLPPVSEDIIRDRGER